MNEVLMFITLLALGVAFYGVFFAAVKWFSKI